MRRPSLSVNAIPTDSRRNPSARRTPSGTAPRLPGGAGKPARFVVASLLSSGVDIGLFAWLYYGLLPGDLPGRLPGAVAGARAVSLLFNYACNRYFVFGDTRADRRFDRRAFGKYLLLAGAVAAASYGFTRLAHALFPAAFLAWVKVLVDSALFFAGYAVQALFVFPRRKPLPAEDPSGEPGAHGTATAHSWTYNRLFPASPSFRTRQRKRHP